MTNMVVLGVTTRTARQITASIKIPSRSIGKIVRNLNPTKVQIRGL
jgi:hypothetical protein